MAAKRKRCSKCTVRYYPKPYQRVCNKCQCYRFWLTSIGIRLTGHLKRIRYRGQLEQTNIIEAIELLRLHTRMTGYTVKEVSVKSDTPVYETTANLELDLSHLYPVSEGGLLVADNLVIAPRTINRQMSNKTYPIGLYDTTGGLVSWDDIKQWVEVNNDLNAIMRQYNLTPKSEPKSEFSGEKWTFNEVLINQSDRLKLKVEQLGFGGWYDLLEGKLRIITDEEIAQRSLIEVVTLELEDEYPLLSSTSIKQVILTVNADRDRAAIELNELMSIRYPSTQDCGCMSLDFPFCAGYCEPYQVSEYIDLGVPF
ncbi:hypothetical protein [Colwellia psychrerythraea]|uniref:Uncharacterized protein n=1 Tax=Colwellia psychrerythraea TaxID=28229 RepID=A0A099L588_COLPS|nr:hypothetical protein [Colwellia psychrerythraea]KGJ97580.1 hypothetical protein GAB14E_1169 [Colwellia psychrerythraea]